MDFDWQKTSAVRGGLQQLRNNTFLSDIHFDFPDDQTIFGHRAIICMRSRKLYDIFNSIVKIDSIKIDDYPIDVYQEFINFLYADDCDVTTGNAYQLLQLAIDHGINELAKKCQHLLLLYTNPLTLLEFCFEKSWIDLEQQTLSSISNNFSEIISSPKFLTIKPEILKLILKVDTVDNSFNEYDLFDVVMKWTRCVCDTNNEHDNGLIKRRILDNLLQLIRFPSMTYEMFGKCIDREPDLLTSDEISAIFLNIATGKKNSFGYSDVKRIVIESAEKLDSSTEDNKPLQDSASNSLISRCALSTSSVKDSDDASSSCTLQTVEKCVMTSRESVCVEPLTQDMVMKMTNIDLAEKNNTESSKHLSVFLKIFSSKFTKVFYFNKFAIKFQVSKPIQLCGIFCYGSCPRLIQFRIYNEQTLLTTFESNTQTHQTMFDPVELQSSVTYTISYKFIDFRGSEISNWRSYESVPWWAESNGVQFKFFSTSYHIGRLYFTKKSCSDSNHISECIGNTTKEVSSNGIHLEKDGTQDTTISSKVPQKSNGTDDAIEKENKPRRISRSQGNGNRKSSKNKNKRDRKAASSERHAGKY